MKKVLIFLLCICMSLIYIGCMNNNDSNNSQNQHKRLVEIEGFMFSDHAGNLLMELSSCTSGMPIKLTDDWIGYSVTTEIPDDQDPNHELYSKIDEDYFIVRVSHPNSNEDASYQDLVLISFHLNPWNQNYSDVRSTALREMPVLLQHNDGFVLSVSPHYYNPSKNGYDKVLAMLIGADPMTMFQNNNNCIMGLQLKTENVAYEANSRVIRLSYYNQSMDAFLWMGEFKIEKSVGNSWLTVYSSTDNDRQDINILGNDTTSLVLTLEDSFKKFEKGDYRVSIIYYRMQLLGIPYSKGGYPEYICVTNFKVVDETVLRNCDYDEIKDTFPGIGFEPEYQSYSRGTTHVKVNWINDSKEVITYGAGFSLQRMTESVWQDVKINPIKDVTFPMIGYGLAPGESRWYKYPIKIYTDGMVTGEYRIRADFLRETYEGKDFGPGNYPNYYLYAYFKIE